jgi:hypothetical protein
MRRIALAAAIVPLVAGCASTPADVETCGLASLPDPVLVLERSEDDQTAALGRYAGGCLDESQPDPVLGQDQFLLQAQATGKAYVAVNTDGSLRAIAEGGITITKTFDVYPIPTTSGRPHGIYGVDIDDGGDLWVSRLDVPSVLVLSPAGAPVTAVDLSALDPDGNPDMNGILVQDGKAFVALEFLQDGDGGVAGDTAKQPGAVAVIDVASHELTGQIQLPGHNPVQRFVPTGSPSVFLMAMPGQHNAVEGDDGIDSIDLAKGTATQVISEEALDGSVDNVVWASPTEAYAIVLGAVPYVNPTSVVQFDPSRGVVTRTLAQAPYFTNKDLEAYVFVGLALDGPNVLVADQTSTDPRIRVFPRMGGAELPSIATKVLPPVSLLALAP